MMDSLKFLRARRLPCALTLMCVVTAVCSAAGATAATTPSAYVYVTSEVGTTGVTETNAFVAAADGSFTLVPGSPFADRLTSMAVNGKFLMGGTDNDININTYYIQPDGAISFWKQTNIVTQNGGCGTVGSLFFDHTGSSLYNFDLNGGQCSNNTYEAFNVVKSTGALTFAGDAGDSEGLFGKLSFIGNNEFAYGSTCYHSGATINGFKRNANGSLTELPQNAPYPTPGGWCPFLAAADPTNHVVIPMYPCNDYGCTGTYQLAVYTADASGNLTTTSTGSNMPAVSTNGVNDISMSPSGQIVAVGGPQGLEIFHMNGANPITNYAVLDSTDTVNQIFWDNANHLYALTPNSLLVYTVTPTAWSAAPGSPHAIPGTNSMIVQPLPRY